MIFHCPSAQIQSFFDHLMGFPVWTWLGTEMLSPVTPVNPNPQALNTYPPRGWGQKGSFINIWFRV